VEYREEALRARDASAASLFDLIGMLAMQTSVSPQTLAARAARLRASYLTRERLTSATAILLYLAALDFIAHVLVGNNYGYFRDELYYMAAGRHLAFGYVDFAPFIAWMAALLRITTNDNLIALHVVSGAASAALVFTTGMIARELGGKRTAQVIAALAANQELQLEESEGTRCAGDWRAGRSVSSWHQASRTWSSGCR
jgi:hypothetical protein